MSAPLAGDARPADGVLLEWRVHLLRQAPPRRIAAVVLVMALVALLALLTFGNPLYALLVLAALAAALSDFLLPIRFRLTGTEAVSSTLLSVRRLSWERVRGVYEHPDGVKLSPLRRPRRLEAFRGVYLWYGGHREEILAVVHKMTQQARENRQEESNAASPNSKPQPASRRRSRTRK